MGWGVRMRAQHIYFLPLGDVDFLREKRAKSELEGRPENLVLKNSFFFFGPCGLYWEGEQTK
jgi:hypothetical protein